MGTHSIAARGSQPRARIFRSASASCAGLTRRMYHTPGSADTSSSQLRARCFVATSSRSRGLGETALTEGDILGPSETLRKSLDYYAHSRDTRVLIERIAEEQPTTLACMHGSAWRGDGGALLRALAGCLG